MKKHAALLLSAVMAVSAVMPAFAGETLTKGEYADTLYNIAKDYNKNLTVGDILRGDGADTQRNKPLTKVEALVMLRRAFGNLPELRGDLLRTAPESGSYTDIPFWAVDDIQKLSKAGVLSEESGEIGAQELVDEDYAGTMYSRMYRLFGSAKDDDFYTTVNRNFLQNSTIDEGYGSSSAMQNMNDDIGYKLADILYNIIRQKHEKGSTEQKVKDFYLTAADAKTRNKLGISPIEPYLKRVREAGNDAELQAAVLQLAKDTTVDAFVGFSVVGDLEVNSNYVPYFDNYEPTFNYSDFAANNDRIAKFRQFLEKTYVLGGNDEKTAEKKADMIIEFETELAKHSKQIGEYTDIEDEYNYYSMKELQSMFGTLDLDAVAKVHGFDIKDKIVVSDPESTKFFGSVFDGKHTELLKAIAEIDILVSFSSKLDEDMMSTRNMLIEAIEGYDPQESIATDAFNNTVSVMSDTLGSIYYKENFSETDKQQVEKIVRSVIAAYRDELEKNSWLGADTKAEAIKKLDNMKVVIGTPDESYDFINDIDIKGKDEGGTYIENIYSILRYNDKLTAEILNGDYDPEVLAFSPYTVNAMYVAEDNAMLLPAGILTPPVFDPDASMEENYGAVGMIAGHEISHAFDINGAKFDENGDYRNWWSSSDYSRFEKYVDKVRDLYNGTESATGIYVNGSYTVNENIADISGLEAAFKAMEVNVSNPDYKKFFESFARMARETTTRDGLRALRENDEHAPWYARVNNAVKNIDKFYEVYDVDPDDGMYVPKDERIDIW